MGARPQILDRWVLQQSIIDTGFVEAIRCCGWLGTGPIGEADLDRQYPITDGCTFQHASVHHIDHSAVGWMEFQKQGVGKE